MQAVSKASEKNIMASVRWVHVIIGTFFCSLGLVQVALANGSSSTIEQILLGQEMKRQVQTGASADAAQEEQWLVDVYQQRGFSSLWLRRDGLNRKGKIILDKLKTAEEHGLEQKAYNVEEILQLLELEGENRSALLDILITEGIHRFIHDLNKGRSKAQLAFPRLFAEAGSVECIPGCVVEGVDSTKLLRSYLDNLGPHHRAYRQLQEALVHYKAIAENGGWPEIEPGKILKVGDTDSRVAAIWQMLFIVGDLQTERCRSSQYDEEMLEGVKRFQFRHGLQVDGIIGQETFAAMNVSAKERMDQIKLNLERWRWHDQNLGRSYVLVNIAGFDLKAVREEKELLEMPIIVGTRHHESPIFSDKIRYIEFNPFWNIPPLIAQNETLIHLQMDPDYLAKEHIRLFSNWQEDGVELDPQTIDWQQVSKKEARRYKFRQEPGPWNALGTMKFVFPNKYSVYLHDTPNHELFKEFRRAYSHGCIRVSDPESLALFLLGEEAAGWDKERVKAIVASGKRTIIKLPKRVPVHLTYMTAWHDVDGVLHFNNDIYHRDKRLQEALTGK